MVEAPSGEAAAEALSTVRRLRDELKTEELLRRSEAGLLRLNPKVTSVEVLAQTLRSWFLGQDCALRRKLELRLPAEPLVIEADRQLLLLVLGGLIQNAFEATGPEQEVTLTISHEAGVLQFDVHSEEVVPNSVAPELFIHRVSTKGPGRGRGLFAARVFGERCLGGQLSFTSSPERGTSFSFRLGGARPQVPSAPPDR